MHTLKGMIKTMACKLYGVFSFYLKSVSVLKYCNLWIRRTSSFVLGELYRDSFKTILLIYKFVWILSAIHKLDAKSTRVYDGRKGMVNSIFDLVRKTSWFCRYSLIFHFTCESFKSVLFDLQIQPWLIVPSMCCFWFFPESS